MRICIINPFSKFAAVRQHNLAKALAEKGNKVTLVLPKFDKYSGYEDSKVPRQKNLRVIHPFQFRTRILELSMLFYIPSALIKLRKKNFDIIHAFRPTPFSGFLGYVLSRIKKVPFVIEYGDLEWKTMQALGSHSKYRLWVVRWMEKFLAKRADALSVMSPYVKKYLEDEYKTRKKTVVVSNGVDHERFSNAKKDKQLCDFIKKRCGASKIIMFIGKLDKAEHVKIMVKAFSNLKKKEYGLVIIGEGKGKGELVREAHSLGIREKCYFAGRKEHEKIPAYGKCADILFAPFEDTEDIKHASNLKLFEYMALGRAILASDVGVVKKTLGGSGIVYDPSSHGDLDRKLHKLCDDAGLRKRLGEKSLKEAKKYDWKTLAERFERFYGDVKR